MQPGGGTTVHETLIQHLIKHFGSLENVPGSLMPFLRTISDEYAELERARQEIEKTARQLSGQQRTSRGARPAGYRFSRDKPSDGPEPIQTGSEGASQDNGDASPGVAIPIEIRGQALGALALDFEDPQAAQDIAPLIEQLSNRLALAVDNARLFQETQNALARTSALLEVSRMAIGFDDADRLLQLVADKVAEILPADRVAVVRFDLEGEEVLNYVGGGPGVDQIEFSIAFRELLTGLSGWVLREGLPAVATEAKQDPRERPDDYQQRRESGAGAIAIVPLISRGVVLGTISAINRVDQPEFTEQDVELIGVVANQVATALDNSALFEDQQRNLRELTTLYEGSRVFTAAPVDLKEVASIVANYFNQLSNASSCAVGLYNSANDTIHFLADVQRKGGDRHSNPNPEIWDYVLSSFPLTKSIFDRGDPAVVQLDDPRLKQGERAYLERFGSLSQLVIPLVLKGASIGLIEMDFSDTEERFSPEQLELYATLAAQAAITLDNARLLGEQQRRALELSTAAEVSRAASSILDPETLLSQTVDLIKDRFDLYYTGIFLVDDSREWAVLRAGSGEAGKIQIERSHQLKVGGESMVGRCIATGDAQIALDVGSTPVHFENPVLPDTRSEMALPLVSRGQTIGAMTIQSTEPEAFTQENIDTLQTMADQLANGIENARLFERAQLQNAELDTLNEMGRELTTQLDRNRIIERTYRFAARLMEFTSFLLAFYHPDTDMLSIPFAIEGGERLSIPPHRADSGLAAHVVKNRAPLLIPEDVPGHAQRLGIRYSTLGGESESWLGAPIISGDQVLGVISVQSTTTPRQYDGRARDLLISIANHAASALQISDLFDQARRQNETLAVLNEMSRALSIQLDVDQVIASVQEYMAQLLGTDSAFIALHDPDQNRIDFRLAVSEKGQPYELPSRALGDGLVDHVIRSREPLLIEDSVEEEVEALGLATAGIGENPKSWLGVPIALGETVIGIIGTLSETTPRKFSERHRDVLVSVAGQAAIAFQNAGLFEQAQQQLADLTIIQRTLADLTASLELEQIIESLLPRVMEAAEADAINMFLVEENSGDLLRVGAYPDPQGDLRSRTGERIAQSDFDLARQVISSGESGQTQISNPESVGAFERSMHAGGFPSLAVVPLTERENVLGLFVIASQKPAYRIGPGDMNLLETLADQSAIGIQNARLFQQTQRALNTSTEQARRLALLNEMSTELNLAEDLQQVFDISVKRALDIFSADRASIATLAPENQLEVKGISGVQAGKDVGDRFRITESTGDMVIRQNRVKTVSNREAEGDDTIRSYMVAPITARSGVVGILDVGSNRPDDFGPQEEIVLQQLVSILGAVISNQQLFEQVERSLAETANLYNASAELNRSQSMADIIRVLQNYSLIGKDALDTSIHTFDRPWKQDEEPRWVQLLARSAVTPLGNLPDRFEFVRLPQREKFLNPNRAGIYEGSPAAQAAHPELETFFSEGLGASSGILVPMVVRGEWFGFVLSTYVRPRKFPKNELQQLMALMGQVGVAVQGLQSLELAQRRAAEAQRRSEELAIVNRVVARVSGALDMNEGLQAVADELGTAVDVGRVGIALLNESGDGLNVIVEHSQDPSIPPGVGLKIPVEGNESTQWVLENRKPLYIRDAQNDPLIAPMHAPFRERGIRAIVILPLLARNEVIGTVGLDLMEEGREFSPEQLNLAETIVLQAANAIQNARLFEETRRRAAQLQTAAEVARDTTASLNLDELLPRAVDYVRDRFGFYHASIFLLDDSRRNAFVRASTGEAGREMLDRGHVLGVGSKSVVGTVTATGEPLVVNDVDRDPTHRPNPLLPDTRAEMAVPLKIGDRVIGALDVQSTSVDAFTQDDLAVLETLADQIAVAVDNSRTYELVRSAVQETRARVQELTTLYTVSQTMTSAPLQMKEIAESAAMTLVEVTGYMNSCSVAVYDPDTDLMRTIADLQVENGQKRFTENPSIWDFSLDDYPATKRVFETIQPLVVQAEEHESDPAELDYMKEVGAQTLLVLPLAAKGQSFGVIEMESRDQKWEPGPDQLNLVMTLANQIAAAIENARLYEEQYESAEQLRELDKLKNQFLANMSHELRTPLNSIIGFSRVILKEIDGPITDLQKQDLTAIYNAGQHLLGLINDILDLSRIEAGKMELNFEDLDIGQLIRSVMSTVRGLVKEKPIQLEEHIETNLPRVRADATRIRQVLLNLLQNAAKFTEEGYIRVRAVQERDADNRPQVRVSVEDTGIGIAPEDQANLFQPFSQVDSSTTRKVGGTGLGLSISRNLIELHGGEITMDSRLGRGSTFHFTLPYERGVPDYPDVEPQRIILSIDDDPRVIELYRRYLKQQGYQVVPLYDPTEAVQMAARLKPYAITLDVMMPNQNGWQVIEELKTNPETKHIPVIFCTIIEDQIKGMRLGATDYLTKPILEEDLIRAVNKLSISQANLRSILVIDDSEADLRLVEKILASIGDFQIRLAHGGVQGMEQLKEKTPDLVILDLAMPKLNGYRIIQNMKRSESLKHIPIIILTGQDLDADLHAKLANISQDLLLKGNLDEQILLASISNSLNKNGN